MLYNHYPSLLPKHFLLVALPTCACPTVCLYASLCQSLAISSQLPASEDLAILDISYLWSHAVWHIGCACFCLMCVMHMDKMTDVGEPRSLQAGLPLSCWSWTF